MYICILTQVEIESDTDSGPEYHLETFETVDGKARCSGNNATFHTNNVNGSPVLASNKVNNS